MSEENKEKLLAGWEKCCIGDVVAYDGVFVDGDWVESKDQDPKGDVRLIQLESPFYINATSTFGASSRKLFWEQGVGTLSELLSGVRMAGTGLRAR